MSNKLAINNGPKYRTEPFPAYNTIGTEEESAVLRVLRSGKLSTYLGAWHDDFYGGTEVQAFEKEWAEKFKVKHAITVNSATSGLFCAVGALGISPGDEIIVSPYTMSASATAAIAYGAIPIFADVEDKYFCLDPQSVREAITDKTKAIIVVDIFGQAYNCEEINKIAEEHNLKVIEDTAQAPGGMFKDKFAGNLGDIGVYSLNYHKHIHTGEGGVVVTDCDELAMKIRLIRNHAEAVLAGKGYSDKEDLVNMVGYNYRMTEIEASIGREQLKKLDNLNSQRLENVDYLNNLLSQIPCIDVPPIRENTKHVHYVNVLLFNEEKAAGIHRNKFIDAVKKELPNTELREDSEVLLSYGYVKPLYKLPMYQEKIAFGKDGYPFNLSDVDYKEVKCTTCEDLHFNKIITNEFIRPGMTKQDLDDVYGAFQKVWENRSELL